MNVCIGGMVEEYPESLPSLGGAGKARLEPGGRIRSVNAQVSLTQSNSANNLLNNISNSNVYSNNSNIRGNTRLR